MGPAITPPVVSTEEPMYVNTNQTSRMSIGETNRQKERTTEAQGPSDYKSPGLGVRYSNPFPEHKMNRIDSGFTGSFGKIPYPSIEQLQSPLL